MKRSLLTWILVLSCCIIQAQLPAVENVRFNQRTDGSLMVDIYYDVTTAGGLPLVVTIEASDDNGISWDLPCLSMSGDVGEYISEGSDKHVLWDFYNDNPNISGSDFKIRVTAKCMVCGQTLTENFTLTQDYFCEKEQYYAIRIGAPGITLDLGGHSISGDMLLYGLYDGIVCESLDSVIIKNGTLEGFTSGVAIHESDHCMVDGLTIRNMDVEDPDIFLNGIVFRNCQDLSIRNSLFEFPYVFHKNAVNSANSDFHVDSIEVNGGGVAVGLSGDQLPDLYKTTGSVTNSKFYNNRNGILITYCDSFLIANNYFSNSCIATDPTNEQDVRWLTIDGNEIYDGSNAIFFRGGSESIISNNIIKNNFTGINLSLSMGCEPGSIKTCFNTTNILVTENEVLGNGIDLLHDEDCTGNTWLNNTYESSIGSEIYNYGPVTANELLYRVDSAAQTFASDAQLLLISSNAADTTGKTYKWIYIYRSDNQQKDYEFWINDGRIVPRDSISIPWDIRDSNVTITEQWINSDSAMILANEQGGREFVFETEYRSSSMKLSKYNNGPFFWEITYLAQDSMLIRNIDALLIEE